MQRLYETAEKQREKKDKIGQKLFETTHKFKPVVYRAPQSKICHTERINRDENSKLEDYTPHSDPDRETMPSPSKK